MNYKFNLGNVSINMPGEGKVEVKDINVEVTDFNLKDIPSIIKETRKAFKDIKESMTESIVDDQAQAHMHEKEEIEAVGAFDDFLNSLETPSLDDPIANMIQEAILKMHPGAKLVKTPQGIAVAVPREMK